MKLKYLLKGKNQIYVAEFTQEWFPQLGNVRTFCGGCFYVDNKLVSLDGGNYNLDIEVSEYKWRNNTELEVVVWK